MKITEKAAYIKGLADGLNLNKETAEGKLIAALIDLAGEVAEAQEKMQEDIDYLSDYVDELDEDLGAVEEAVYGDCCDDDYDCCCCDEDDEDIDDGFEITCPSCGATIVFDGTVDDDGELVCPNGKEKIVYDTEDKA